MLPFPLHARRGKKPVTVWVTTMQLLSPTFTVRKGQQFRLVPLTEICQ